MKLKHYDGTQVITTTNHNNNIRINNQQVFECVINTRTQNTTTNHNQTYDTIQNLKFGMYPIVVYLQTQPMLPN